MLKILRRLDLVLDDKPAYVVCGVVDEVDKVSVIKPGLRGHRSLNVATDTPLKLSISAFFPVSLLDWLCLLCFPGEKVKQYGRIGRSTGYLSSPSRPCLQQYVGKMAEPLVKL